MNVTISNTIVIENPTDALKIWCQKNLAIPNPDYAKKARMHLWLGNTPPKLYLYEQHGNTLILPFGALRQFPPEEAIYKSDFADPVMVDYGADVPLYDYQTQAVEQVFAKHYGILQAPAGSGKTQMGIALIKRFRRRALWLTHTLDLLKQSKDRAELYTPSELIGTITEGKVNLGRGITFATIQTMCKLDLAQYKDYWDVIVVDECHGVCGAPTAMTMFSKVLNSLSARHKYGLSATVHRADGLIVATHALFGEIVYTVPEEAVGDRIMKAGINPIGTGIELSKACQNTDGTLNYTKLISYLCESRERNTVILNSILQNGNRPCLILSDRLNHLEFLMKSLPLTERRGAVMISGKMTSKQGKAERERAIKDMRTGQKNLLFATYNLCKEGLDIPRLERLFMTTPVKDYAVVVQSVGRIARTWEGKSDPIAYDFVDNILYCVKAYKQRLKHYKKARCYICE
ncbi:MAG: DEAD/DEAH box helicase family protein [Eubacterium sp.]|nr:DEAD/DEAH box helicase family protein [Eubacterium sp.]